MPLLAPPPYPVRTVSSMHVQLHKGEWKWHSLVSRGAVQSEFQKHCPRTSEILLNIPGFMTDVPFAYAFFSTLPAGSRTCP